ncbi:MAG: hypothetical protein DRP56_07835 [Planctomycetota bacterium]|nr:MAG: hypothetical protein DRP56_07835 [Planctomycetota bacterium]RKY11447.1 MAG: hypothetical protein DRP52_05940 [Planctomycetota bacterium]
MNQRGPVEPISKAFYFGIYLGGAILGGILMAIAMFAIIGGAAASESGDFDPAAGGAIAGAGVLVLLLAIACLLASSIVLFVLYYKMWNAIQDGYARTTPGKAVGFMFIPFFNIYWMFQAIWGYSKDYNEFLRRHAIAAKPLSEGLFLAACIVPWLGIIPFVGWLASIANLVIFIIIVNAICDSINALAYIQPQAAILEPEYDAQQELPHQEM